MTELPPCCADLDEPPCPQHRQAARVVGHDGIRTHGRPSALTVGYTSAEVAEGRRATEQAARRRGARGTGRGRGAA